MSLARGRIVLPRRDGARYRSTGPKFEPDLRRDRHCLRAHTAQAANSPIASARIKLVGGHLCASGRLLMPCGQAQGRLMQLPDQIARGVNPRVGVVECCSGLPYESMSES